MSWTIDRLGTRHDKPFFLACGLHKPHMPWNVPRKYYDMFPLDKIILPKVLETDLDDIPAAGVKIAKPQGDHRQILESGRWKDAVQGYLAAIAFADTMIGRLIDALDKSPQQGQHDRRPLGRPRLAPGREAALAQVHPLGGGDPRPPDLRRPRRDQARERLQPDGRLHEHLPDPLRPLRRARPPRTCEGKSLKPLLANPEAAWDRPALTTYMFNNHAVRSERWRYIRYNDGSEELYDEDKDPMEWTNVAARPELAAVKAELARSLPATNAPDAGPKDGGRRRATSPRRPRRRRARRRRRRRRPPEVGVCSIASAGFAGENRRAFVLTDSCVWTVQFARFRRSCTNLQIPEG